MKNWKKEINFAIFVVLDFKIWSQIIHLLLLRSNILYLNSLLVKGIPQFYIILYVSSSYIIYCKETTCVQQCIFSLGSLSSSRVHSCCHQLSSDIEPGHISAIMRHKLFHSSAVVCSISVILFVNVCHVSCQGRFLEELLRWRTDTTMLSEEAIK